VKNHDFEELILKSRLNKMYDFASSSTISTGSVEGIISKHTFFKKVSAWLVAKVLSFERMCRVSLCLPNIFTGFNRRETNSWSEQWPVTRCECSTSLKNQRTPAQNDITRDLQNKLCGFESICELYRLSDCH
jgi:hypothetical protein